MVSSGIPAGVSLRAHSSEKVQGASFRVLARPSVQCVGRQKMLIRADMKGLVAGLYHLGSKDWPFAWFQEWPFNFDDFPDFHAYLYGKRD